MEKGQNPLYPNSEGEGVVGAYEMAALLDDRVTRWSRAKPKHWSRRSPRFCGVSITRADVAKNAKKNKVLLAMYHENVRDLEEQFMEGLIDSDEFRIAKKNLARAATELVWHGSWPATNRAVTPMGIRKAPQAEQAEKEVKKNLETLEF